MCVKAEENSLGRCVKHHIEPLIVADRISNTLPKENSTQPKEYRKKNNEEGLNNWKRMHGCNAWAIPQTNRRQAQVN